MDIFLNICRTTAIEGFMYAIMAMGVYITYSILDFPDLSVDGSMPLGAIATGVLIIAGVNPWLALLLSFVFGAAAGTVTGILHVKFKIRPLLCGILVYTGLLSINLSLLFAGTGGLSIASFYNGDTVFNSFPATLIPVGDDEGSYSIRALVVAIAVCIIFKLLLDYFLKTKAGLLLRATGDNQRFVTMLAKDPGRSKIIGLAIGNGFAAVSGSIIAQLKSTADQSMGVGMVVLALASVIIGLSLFAKVPFIKATTMVILGSIVYKACLSTALALGLPTQYLKLLMAVIFTVALVLGGVLSRKRGDNDVKI